MARGSSTMGVVALGLLLVLALGSVATVALQIGAEWTVGDDQGWSFGVTGWPNGKAIRAGDVLVFKYNPKMHDVVEVDEKAYNLCNPGNGSSWRFTSGHDRILVEHGKTFYICSMPGHCLRGMKITIEA
ncbi:hypothetical protein ACP70R_029344 [Stipagrostis hirtigluma subsp. patula]